LKLGKRKALLLAIGIPIILFGSLGMARSQQLQEQTGLQGELSSAESSLNKFRLEELISKQQELEKRLSQTTSELEALSATISQPIESITASGTLFDIAEACGVRITEVSSSGWPVAD